MRVRCIVLVGLALALRATAAAPPDADPGYAAWLRHSPLESERQRVLAAQLHGLRVEIEGDADDTLRAAAEEIQRGLAAMLPTLAWEGDEAIAARLSLCVTPDGPGEGYRLQGRVDERGRFQGRLTSATSTGVLRGAFAWLRRIQLAQPLAPLDVASEPALPLRLINHWDNLDGTVERGYAG